MRSPRLRRTVRRVFEAACRDMIGGSFADHVGLPFGPSDFAFRYVLRPTVSALGKVHHRIPGAAKRAQRIGERYWTAVSSEASPKGAPSS